MACARRLFHLSAVLVTAMLHVRCDDGDGAPVSPQDADAGPDTVADVDGSADSSGDVDAAADSGPVYAETFRVVRVDASVSLPDQLAVHACAGLFNARAGGSVFVQADDDVPQAAIDGTRVNDEVWLGALGLTPAATIAAGPFVAECVETFGGCVRYGYAAQQEILPSILTVAAVHGVPPIDADSAVVCDAPVVDAETVFAELDTPIEATQYVYENHLAQTTGLAMLNPGYDRNAPDLANPDITEDMQVALIDFVFSRRLFVLFLVNGCTDGHAEEDLLSRIVADSPWPKPFGVYGYNDSWLVGGYLHEAQTRCIEAANMGAIPTRTSNLSFFDTRSPAVTATDALAHNAPQQITYDPAKTYVAFVIGDGDNVRYIMSTRRDWLEQRLQRCADATPACPPLTWTISPHLPDIAPDVLRWYYTQAATTGADYFALPPSGALYAYPGHMPNTEQQAFVDATEAAARILGTHSVIHWEWFEGWERAVETFLPRYAHRGGQIRGVFPVNVPFVFEAFPSWPAEQMVQLLTGDDGVQLALFRSQSWRGVDGRDDFHPTPQTMADRLAALPVGTVTWVYMTSDGGLNLENSYVALTELLADHIELVSTDAAADLAIAAAQR